MSYTHEASRSYPFSTVQDCTVLVLPREKEVEEYASSFLSPASGYQPSAGETELGTSLSTTCDV